MVWEARLNCQAVFPWLWILKCGLVLYGCAIEGGSLPMDVLLGATTLCYASHSTCYIACNTLAC
eukprot:5801073-Pleurochrysis_carterae.AAC.1